MTVPPSVPKTCREAMKMPVGELCNAASNNEIKSLEDLKVFELVPCSTVPPRNRFGKSMLVTTLNPENTCEARLVAQD